MRIEFAHAEQPGRDWNSRELRIGSAPDNDLEIAGPGVAEHHLRLLHDPRGLVLLVNPGAGRVYVNARPVRERALLRAGDSLGVGDVVLRLSQPQAASEPVKIDSASLRAVAGPLSGRAQSIQGRLDLGGTGNWPLGLGHAPQATVSIVREDDGMHLHTAHLPETFILSVNGISTRDAILHDGDQINLGPHRFVLDACASQGEMDTRDAADEESLPEDSAGPRREVWWLIVTAAALALLIATLLFVRL